MKFFDSLIDDVREKLSEARCQKLSFDERNATEDEGFTSVILQRDSAFEMKGIGFNLVSCRELKDEIYLYGRNLPEITGDCAYGRIALISIEDVSDEQRAHDLIKKIEYVKYHTFPKGYMMRSTSDSSKEAVRVSKKALKQGMDFSRVGSLLIKKYKEIPEVKAVTLIFLTGEEAKNAELAPVSKKATEITKALNHIMEQLDFDCNSCKLKPVCDEVEGMRELHFRSAGKKGE